ncbi:MAG: tol-pal system protein YbgF [Alphaproteobacteria bacterium]|nr:tol-pal system protein YbgF [Alphaproteobacteria bacterium]
MNKIWLSGLFMGVLFTVYPLCAADWQQDIDELRKEVQQLHQKLYSIDERPAGTENSGNAQMRDKIDEYGATLHRISERMDELEKKIKQYNDNLDKFNQKTDVRLKVLESRKSGIEVPSALPSVSETNESAASSVGSGVINGNKPEDMYANAMQAYNNALYDEAELGFEDIIKQFPSHALASNSQYWLGEVYTKQGDFNKAKWAFKNGYEKYKNGNKGADCLYKLGVTLENQHNNKGACVVFMSFAEEFPKANAELSKKVKSEAQKLGCK